MLERAPAGSLTPSVIRVLAVVPNLADTSPGQRFRIEQWAPFLRAAGIEVDLQPFEDEALHAVLYRRGETGRKCLLVGAALARRMKLVRRIDEYDLVYLFREAALVGPGLLERWMSRRVPPVIFDFDDAVFLRYRSPTNGLLTVVKCPAKIRTICKLADHVLAGNEFLADYARAVNRRVTVLPTTIDTTAYTPEPRKPNDPPVIGWSGSHSTLQHLDTVRTALQRLAEKERFRLRVIGTPAYEVPGVATEAVVWSAAQEVADLRAIDIGIMPLPSDEWSRGKCGLKALQYMALGIPTVCSPVGVNNTIISDGDNGLLAATDDEWVEALTRLLRSPELRRRLGAAGRRTVENEYSGSAHAARLATIIRDVASAAAGMATASSRAREDAAAEGRP